MNAPVNQNKATWEKGDFTRVAAAMRQSGEELVNDIGIRKGQYVLDLGCGDGTTALPAARLGANVLGVDISAPLVAAGNRRAKEAGLKNITFQEGDACNLAGIENKTFDHVVSIFGAMFAPKPLDAAKEMVRVTKPGGRVTMGNWIPGDPSYAALMFKICASYSPPPPEGFASPMLWGIEQNVAERFSAAGVSSKDVSCVKTPYTFYIDGTPKDWIETFRLYFGPAMNAFEAAEKNGKADDLRRELVEMATSQNISTTPGKTIIKANYLRVTVNVR